MSSSLFDPTASITVMNAMNQMQQPNPYTDFPGKLSMPGFYTGDAGNLPPTNASGQPIQSFVDYNKNAQNQYQQQLQAFNAANPGGGGGSTPGTTLNSMPPGQQDNGLTALNDMKNNIVAQNLTLQGMPSSLNQGGFGSGNNVLSNTASAQTRDNAIALDQLNRQISQAGAPAAAPAGPTPPSPPDLRQAYLNALANPGPVTTPGATVPQGPTDRAIPSVTDAFMAANQGGGGPGAGNYNNSGFFSTLDNLRNAAGVSAPGKAGIG